MSRYGNWNPNAVLLAGGNNADLCAHIKATGGAWIDNHLMPYPWLHHYKDVTGKDPYTGLPVDTQPADKSEEIQVENTPSLPPETKQDDN